MCRLQRDRPIRTGRNEAVEGQQTTQSVSELLEIAGYHALSSVHSERLRRVLTLVKGVHLPMKVLNKEAHSHYGLHFEQSNGSIEHHANGALPCVPPDRSASIVFIAKLISDSASIRDHRTVVFDQCLDIAMVVFRLELYALEQSSIHERRIQLLEIDGVRSRV